MFGLTGETLALETPMTTFTCGVDARDTQGGGIHGVADPGTRESNLHPGAGADGRTPDSGPRARDQPDHHRHSGP